jgi:di/tricarboxylate transporter
MIRIVPAWARAAVADIPSPAATPAAMANSFHFFAMVSSPASARF